MPPPVKCAYIICPLPACTKPVYRFSQSRSFSSSPSHDQRLTRNRRQLFRWLNTTGINFEKPASGSTNYLSAYTPDGKLRRSEGEEEDDKDKDFKGGSHSPLAQGKKEKKVTPPELPRDLRPFPLNRAFRSQSVLSEEMREKIWEKVMVENWSVRQTSAEFGVEMRRVGAVARLKEIEKEWQRIGKPLTKTYAAAVMNMLPKTRFVDPHSNDFSPHESINDLPLHSATGHQIFHPTSESRAFTRADAAKVFHDKLLPADDRVPHPELTLMRKDHLAGMSKEEVTERQEQRDALVELNRTKFEHRQAKRMKMAKVVSKPRWDFRITPINVEDVGVDGRGHKGVGWRYGMPLMDRSRAAVKIPTTAGH